MPSILRTAALALCLVPLSLAQEGPDPFLPERILPADALLFLSIPQSAAVSQDYAKSNLARLVNHPEIQAFIDPLMKWWTKRRTQGAQVAGEVEPAWNEVVKRTIGLTIDDLWDLLHGPLSLAVYDVPLGPDHKADVVLTLGAADAGGLEKAAVQVKEALKQQGGVTEGEYNRQGVTIREFGTDAFRVFYAAVQKTLIIATQQARLEKILDAAADRNAAGLGNEAGFKAARARVAPDNRHFFLLHLNLAQLLKQYRREIGDEALKVLETLGISDISSLAAAMDYDGPFIRERYALMAAQQSRGLLKFLSGGSPGDPAARWVPAGALSYTHFGVNLAEMYDVLRAASKVSPDFERNMNEFFGAYEQRVGLKVRDAFATLGSSWTAWSAMPDGGGIFPDALYAVSLADPAAFEDALGKVLKDGGVVREEMEFRGQKIRYFSLGLDNFLPGVGGVEFIKFGYPIVYFIREKTLFFSTNPLALKRQILRFAGAGDPIAKDPRWTALASKVPQGGWELWAYTDLGRMINIFYSALEPFSHVVRDLPRDPQTGDLIIDLARMPLGETLADLVGATLTAKRTHPDAIVLESWSNTGASLTSFSGYIVSVAAIAIPVFMQMQGGAVGGVAQNEMMAEVSLQFVRQAQETFKNSDSDRNGAADFWTRDIAGLYGLKDRSGQAIFLIDPATAQADVDGAPRYGLTPSPKNGYFYRIMVTDPDGEAYQKDDDKDGSNFTNKARYGVSALPAVYPSAGRFTFITNESGKTWKKDTEGKPVDKWPAKDPSKDGWQPLD